MWRLLQKKQIHETFKDASLDSTRGLGQHVLGQRSNRTVLQEFCGQERATDNKFQKHKVRVRTSERFQKILSFKFKLILHVSLSINFSKHP